MGITLVSDSYFFYFFFHFFFILAHDHFQFKLMNFRFASHQVHLISSHFCQFRLFTVLYFSVRSPRSHSSSETGAIFVYVASATWRDDDNPPRVAGVGNMRVGGCGARKTLPDTRPLGGLSSVALAI